MKGTSIEQLKQLYPNYFGGIASFIKLVNRFLPATGIRHS